MTDITLTRADCLARDGTDPLASLRQRFDLPAGVIYLDGNSLGARPRTALARAQDVVAREWGADLIRSWNDAGWFDMPRRLGDRLAPLIGAHAAEVAVTDTTSLNLFKALAAALRIQANAAVATAAVTTAAVTTAASSSPNAATSRPISIWPKA